MTLISYLWHKRSRSMLSLNPNPVDVELRFFIERDCCIRSSPLDEEPPHALEGSLVRSADKTRSFQWTVPSHTQARSAFCVDRVRRFD